MHCLLKCLAGRPRGASGIDPQALLSLAGARIASSRSSFEAMEGLALVEHALAAGLADAADARSIEAWLGSAQRTLRETEDTIIRIVCGDGGARAATPADVAFLRRTVHCADVPGVRHDAALALALLRRRAEGQTRRDADDAVATLLESSVPTALREALMADEFPWECVVKFEGARQ